MDQMSAGTLVAAALSAGAAEAGKAVLGKAAADAYDNLKALLTDWAAPDVTALEAQARGGGDAKDRQAVLADAINARSECERNDARALAEALSAALAADGRSGALATVVNNFHAGRDQYVAQLGGIINIDRRGK